MLKMVERFPLGSEPGWGFQSPKATQAMLEAMRLGFADKAMWMGDNRPGFYADMPLAGLLSSTYLAQRSSLIDPAKRMPPNPPPGDPRGFGATAQLQAAEPEAEPGGHTSHFSVIDRWGNVVSVTTTLGDGLGCTIMVPGYGFMLNDASGRNLNQVPVAGRIKAGMVDPGANDAAGGKRGLGNVAPVIVLKDGEPVLATGGAGGAQIMPAVFEIVSDVLDFHKTIQDALNAPRIWGDENNVIWNSAADPIPLLSKLEGITPWSEVPPWFAGAPAFPDTTLQALAALGDPLSGSAVYPQVGGTESIAVDPDTYALSAAADPRGLWAVGGPIVLKP
jgi:gamma-glutamyltranspeptidase/glutathione hydrolase